MIVVTSNNLMLGLDWNKFASSEISIFLCNNLFFPAFELNFFFWSNISIIRPSSHQSLWSFFNLFFGLNLLNTGNLNSAINFFPDSNLKIDIFASNIIDDDVIPTSNNLAFVFDWFKL